MADEKKNIEPQTSSQSGFFRLVKGLLIADAAVVLWVCSGFIVPSKLTPLDPERARPDGYYDVRAKVSPYGESRRTAALEKRTVHKAPVMQAGLATAEAARF